MEITDIDSTTVSEESKKWAIVAHITLIGWIITLVMNGKPEVKNQFTSFYLRQMIGLILLMFVGSILTIIFIGFLIQIAAFVFWIMSIVGANNKEKQPTPIVGEYFQKWFSAL